MAGSKVRLKLLINTQTNRVLFAETGKDCVDFLFQLMSLPISTVVRLLRQQGMVGCLGNLYESIENLNEAYIEPHAEKDSLLKPVVSSVTLSLLEGSKEGYVCPECDVDRYSDDQCAICPDCQSNLTYSIIYVAPPPGECGSGKGGLGYICPKCDVSYYSDDKRAICPDCKRKMTHTITYVVPPPAVVAKPSGDQVGFVKGAGTFMVMDDLVVTPMSTISSLALLNRFKVKDIGALKEKEVLMGMNEKLLKTSLQSKNVLSDVFLTNNK